MLKPNCRTLLILASLGFSLSAFAGAGSSGGGADTIAPSAGAAWFIGQGKQIKVCIEVAQDFGMPKGTDPASMVQTVFKNWQNYVLTRQIERDRTSMQKLVFDLNVLPSCDGSQDLAFYLGENNDDVLKAKTLYNDPLAFSFRQKFDEKIGWGKGFIWVKGSDPARENPSLWQDPLRLQATLMHEVGHVLGCDHVSGTVMSSEFASFINEAAYTVPSIPQAPTENRAQYFANHIDGSTQLYWCIECSTHVRGEIGVPKRFESKPGFDPKITFTRFMGRAPVGKMEATFQMELNENNDQHPFKSLSVVYKDSAGSKTIPFLMRQGGVGFDQSNSAWVFNVYASNDPKGGTASPPAMGGVFEGYARDASGKLLPITVAVNSGTNYAWLQIDYASGLVDLPLFRAPSTPE